MSINEIVIVAFRLDSLLTFLTFFCRKVQRNPPLFWLALLAIILNYIIVFVHFSFPRLLGASCLESPGSVPSKLHYNYQTGSMSHNSIARIISLDYRKFICSSSMHLHPFNRQTDKCVKVRTVEFYTFLSCWQTAFFQWHIIDGLGHFYRNYVDVVFWILMNLARYTCFSQTLFTGLTRELSKPEWIRLKTVLCHSTSPLTGHI